MNSRPFSAVSALISGRDMAHDFAFFKAIREGFIINKYVVFYKIAVVKLDWYYRDQTWFFIH